MEESKSSTLDRGFTLIELMIAVAIISILASVAVPNYQNFRNKAKQSEAKANLSGLYAAQKAFHAEHTTYTGDFRDIGFLIEGSLTYDVGFAGPGAMPPIRPSESPLCGPRTAFNTEVSICALAPGSWQARVDFAPAPALNGCGAGEDPTGSTFRATAIGILAGDPGSAMPDFWTIDQHKTLCNNQTGW